MQSALVHKFFEIIQGLVELGLVWFEIIQGTRNSRPKKVISGFVNASSDVQLE